MQSYPHLLPQYRRMFPGAYAPKAYSRQVHGLVDVLQQRYGIQRRAMSGAGSQQPDAGRQLALAL